MIVFELLFVFFLTAPSFAMESAPVDHVIHPPKERYIGRPVQKRQHHLALEYGGALTKVKYRGAFSGETRSNVGEIRVFYGYEFGYFQPWISIQSTVASSGIDEFQTNHMGIGLRTNFIRNAPGADFIPYFSMGLGHYDSDYNNSPLLNLKGTTYGASLGFSWLPFGEIAAIDVSYEGTYGRLNANDGQNKDKVRLWGRGLSLKYSFFF